MADKIVQLVDQNDDNIYPVAGAMKDGTVDTNTIMDGAVTADKIDFTTSTDSRGWIKMPISNKINVYLNRGNYNKTMSSASWTEETAAEKPVDLDTSNLFLGGAGGLSSDHAINVCGYIDWEGAKARVQLQNIHSGTVTSNIYWWAYIIEFLA